MRQIVLVETIQLCSCTRGLGIACAPSTQPDAEFGAGVLASALYALSMGWLSRLHCSGNIILLTYKHREGSDEARCLLKLQSPNRDECYRWEFQYKSIRLPQAL